MFEPTAKSEASKPPRRGRLKKLLIAAAVVVVLLVGAVGLLVPMFAGGILIPRIEAAARQAINGSVRIESLSVSWTGNQTAKRVELLDPDGTVIAQADLTVERSLLGLLRSPNDLGTVRLSGWVEIDRPTPEASTNIARAIEPRSPASQPKPTAGPARLPALDMNLDLSGIRLDYSVGGRKIGLQNLSVSGQISLAGNTNLTINATPSLDQTSSTGQDIRAELRAGPVLNTARELELSGSNLEFTLNATVPSEFAALLSGSESPDSSTRPEPIRIAFSAREQNGRLVSGNATQAMLISGSVPASLVAGFAPEGSLEINDAPKFTLRTTALDLPIALLSTGTEGSDLRDASLVLALSTDAVDANIINQNGQRTTLRIEPVDLRAGSENFADYAFAQGDLRALVGGTPAGTALLDVRIDRLLTENGRLAGVDRVRPRGQLSVVDAPASVIDTIAARFDALGPDFASAVFGEQLSLTVSAEARADLGSSDTAIESPMIGIDLVSPRTTVQASGMLDGDRFDAPGRALTIESSAGRELLARFAPKLLEAMEPADADITIAASAEDILAIQGSGLPIDYQRLNASMRVSIDRHSPSTGGLDRVVASIDARAGSPVQLSAFAIGSRSGTESTAGLEPFNIALDLDLVGLNALAAATDPLLAEGFTADGSASLTGLPIELVERLAAMEPGTLTRAIGTAATGRIVLKPLDQANTASIEITTQVAELTGGFRLHKAILTASSPLAISAQEPEQFVRGLTQGGIIIDGRQAIAISGPRDFSATVAIVDLDLTRLDDAQAIASSIARAAAFAPDLEMINENGQRLTFDSLQLHIAPIDGVLQTQLVGTADATTILDVLTDLPVQSLLDGAELVVLIGESQKNLTGSASIPPWLISAFAADRSAIINAALTEQPVQLTIQPASTGSSIAVHSGESTIRTSVNIGAQQIAIGQTEASLTASPDQFRAVLSALSTESDAPTIGLASKTTLDVIAEPFSVPFDQADGFNLTGLSARATMQGSTTLTGVIDRDGSPRDLGVRNASASIAFGSDGPTIDATAQAFDPQQPQNQLGELRANLQPQGRFDVRLASAKLAGFDTWLSGAAAPQGPLALTFGSSLDLRARTSIVPGLPDGTDRIEMTIASPRLNTELLANRSPDRIELAEPFEAAWTIAPAMFDELFALAIADETGSSLRLREAAPAAIAVRTCTVRRGTEGYEFARATIDAEFAMVNANFDALLGEDSDTQTSQPVELGKIQGRISRDQGSTDPIRFSLLSLDAQTNEPVFTVEGTIDSDAPSPILNASVEGSVPTALIDVLAGQRGLLVAATGDSVRVQANAAGIAADRSTGRLTATVQAGRAEAAAFGRFENGALVLGDGAASRTNITLSEITPELSRRAFEPLFPLLKDFRKSRDDAPTMITVTSDSLAIPVDGDLSKLSGSINLNLGSVRFEAGDLLGAVLSATSNRAAGQLGQSVPPVLVRFNNGVASYDAVDIPFGDVTLRTRGSIDLVNRRMDILVLIPLETLSGDIRSAAERNPLVGQLAAVPFRARGEFGKAKLELDPTAIQDLIPGAIEGQLNDLINQGLRDLFRR